MSKILISGGSGMLGKAISEVLLEKGHEVVWLGRKAGSYKGIKMFAWDPQQKKIDLKALEKVDVIIHLAGASIADKRWTKEYKRTIINSRVQPIEFLHEVIVQNSIQIKQVIGASAIGYYGSNSLEKMYDESDGPAADFLAETCKSWEESYDPYSKSDIPLSIVRIGVVFSKQGGAYPKLRSIVNSGFGAALGTGKQYFPWIHIDDLASLFVFVMTEKKPGVYNAVSDQMITNKEFTHLLAKSIGKRIFFPNIPSFVLHLLLGERAVMLLTGPRISNKKIKEAGFRFRYADINSALKDLSHQ